MKDLKRRIIIEPKKEDILNTSNDNKYKLPL